MGRLIGTFGSKNIRFKGNKITATRNTVEKDNFDYKDNNKTTIKRDNRMYLYIITLSTQSLLERVRFWVIVAFLPIGRRPTARKKVRTNEAKNGTKTPTNSKSKATIISSTTELLYRLVFKAGKAKFRLVDALGGGATIDDWGRENRLAHC